MGASPEPAEVIAVLNGPGEISAWFEPFARLFHQRAPATRMVAALVPCPFATGREAAVVAAIPGISAVSPPRSTLRHVLGGAPPPALAGRGPRLVLHFGGELLLSLLLARRQRCPLLAYAERPLPLARWADRVFLVRPPRRPLPPARYEVVGNLQVDAARMRCPRRRSDRRGEPTIGLYPGSRDYQAWHMVPFLARVAELLARDLPRARFMLARADYVALDRLREIAAEPDGRILESQVARWEPGDGDGALVTPDGVRLEVRSGGEVMSEADLALTIPGSNTAELAALGVPMIVLVPSYQGEVHPAPGLLGHVGRLPLLGRYVKRGLLHAYARRLRFLAIPNRQARRALVPEMIGRLTPRAVAEAVRRELAVDRPTLARDLIATMGPPGAASRLVEAVLARLPGEPSPA